MAAPKSQKLKSRAYGREYAGRPHVRDKVLAKYGITAAQYDQMFLLQHGSCALCHTSQHELPIRLAVDHCHTRGHVRSLLCVRCNRLVGLIENNLELVTAILRYIER